MPRRISIGMLFVASTVAFTIASAASLAAGCDRVVLSAVSPQTIAVAPLQFVAPTNVVAFGNPSCHAQDATALVVPQAVPFAVSPLAVVPFYAAPVIVPAQVHAQNVRVVAVRPLVARPLIVRPSRSRSVTRVRTLAR